MNQFKERLIRKIENCKLLDKELIFKGVKHNREAKDQNMGMMMAYEECLRIYDQEVVPKRKSEEPVTLLNHIIFLIARHDTHDSDRMNLGLRKAIKIIRKTREDLGDPQERLLTSISEYKETLPLEQWHIVDQAVQIIADNIKLHKS